MNKVILIGRLTKDPELKYTNTNIPVARFTLAVNRPFSNQQGEREADFISIIVWRKQAENVKNYMKQGSQVAVEGRIQTRNYDGEDGKKVYVTEVQADNVQFLDTKNSNRDGQSYNNGFDNVSYSKSNQPNNENTISTTDIKNNDPFADFGANIEISDEELPF